MKGLIAIVQIIRYKLYIPYNLYRFLHRGNTCKIKMVIYRVGFSTKITQHTHLWLYHRDFEVGLFEISQQNWPTSATCSAFELEEFQKVPQILSIALNTFQFTSQEFMRTFYISTDTLNQHCMAWKETCYTRPRNGKRRQDMPRCKSDYPSPLLKLFEYSKHSTMVNTHSCIIIYCDLDSLQKQQFEPRNAW